LSRSVHINRPGKKQIPGFDLPPIAVPETNKKQSVPGLLTWSQTAEIDKQQQDSTVGASQTRKRAKNTNGS